MQSTLNRAYEMCRPILVMHCFKLSKLYATTRAWLNFFLTRTIDAWNSLPQSVVETQLVNTFKNLLDNYYSNQMFVIDF